MQRALKHCSSMFQNDKVGYGDILNYTNNQIHLTSIGNSFCVPELSIGPSISEVRNSFLTNFESLNINLLKYIPEKSDGKWCMFPSILEDYSVSLPRGVRDIIRNKISFPGQNMIPQEELIGHLCSSTNALFQPGHDISLGLHKSATLGDLKKLVIELELFKQPLLEHLQMMIFFKLYTSTLYDKYIQYNLKKISENQHEPQLCHQMDNLVEALSNTRGLVQRIVNGTANYSEIIAEDEGVLQGLDIKKEFSILFEYAKLSMFIESSFVALDGVMSMLELHQYTTHIANILQLCNQYKTLECCNNDPNLKRLEVIMEESMDRSKLTLQEAKEKLEQVKKILCMTDSKCLDIFAIMSNSAEFYKFILDKKFYDHQGQKMFSQQYELITAQLQHEEYDESVLNHLLVAFKIVILFMDSKKTFTELIGNVSALNASHGFKQFDTVNDNITLIRLWFARVEVRVMLFVVCL